MYYISPTPNPSSAYPAPQSNLHPGLLPLTDEQVKMVVDYNGFVAITETEDGITVTPNLPAWEAWRASQPPEPLPEPTAEERLSALEAAMLSIMGVTSDV